ncbi:MAG: KpsF/GutQ family sugar-phosphate isomerase [Marinomonas sp.]|jgi:arabinose-5-phosphate isomerase|uniref:KpsF/GutQ family sugar-phosphate isomerase n=1 Tax=Marinomonas communis TaxID=28254 RepID=UPI0010007565|nr:KpsF/GutQ family sugar-phosphate isomerase [Marinomonas communis]MCC4273346.1 KpsF/GutQ family sugar-phosphate isomerase [Marinomonas communis]RUM51566.1 MAG: KpsF/GutQ family sugar-phosphate isomerase [Marinomonas sp.]RUM52740.1 MAG: KpsF/GutQ family sugar-phosphate isomerase [Marinomonas sp.]
MSETQSTLSCDSQTLITSAKTTLTTQAQALMGLADRVDTQFSQAVTMMLNTKGRVIICGMGKSGIVGKKIAATLASTGTPSFFMHPGEAFHGDLGMVQQDDLLILISYSGETEEVIRLLPSLQSFGNQSIAIVGNSASTLGQHCDCVLDIAIDREVCPNNLAPTTSTTMTIAMGDALAVALMQCRDFQPQDFARFHPGGSLGRKLLTRVRDLMHKDNLPFCSPETSLQDAIAVMTQGRKGVVLIKEGERLAGIFTDGDLRRAMLKDAAGMLSKTMSELMTANPKTISQDTMIVEAEERMLRDKITLLVAVDDNKNVVGLLEIYDR